MPRADGLLEGLNSSVDVTAEKKSAKRQKCGMAITAVFAVGATMWILSPNNMADPTTSDTDTDTDPLSTGRGANSSGQAFSLSSSWMPALGDGNAAGDSCQNSGIGTCSFDCDAARQFVQCLHDMSCSTGCHTSDGSCENACDDTQSQIQDAFPGGCACDLECDTRYSGCVDPPAGSGSGDGGDGIFDIFTIIVLSFSSSPWPGLSLFYCLWWCSLSKTILRMDDPTLTKCACLFLPPVLIYVVIKEAHCDGKTNRAVPQKPAALPCPSWLQVGSQARIVTYSHTALKETSWVSSQSTAVENELKKKTPAELQQMRQLKTKIFVGHTGLVLAGPTSDNEMKIEMKPRGYESGCFWFHIKDLGEASAASTQRAQPTAPTVADPEAVVIKQRTPIGQLASRQKPGAMPYRQPATLDASVEVSAAFTQRAQPTAPTVVTAELCQPLNAPTGEVTDWLRSHSLEQYAGALASDGYGVLKFVAEMEDGEVDALVASANMKRPHERTFRAAVKTLAAKAKNVA